MNIRPITTWSLYKYRFAIAYTLLAIVVGTVLLLYGNDVPPGISQSEQQSVVTSSNFSYTQLREQNMDLPYHLLQKLSIELLGVTPYGVRLPSLIFGAFTALFLTLILRRWFQTNVAIVSCFIILTSSWFLGIARLGDPGVMIPFWTSLLLLAATYISQQTPRWKLWKIVFLFSAALSLYTPYMVYLFAATIIAAFAQPHLRYLIRESSKVGLGIGVFFFIAVLVPLGWSIYKDPAIIMQLLVIPSNIPGPIEFGHSLWVALTNYVNPFTVGFSTTITPVLSIASAALVGIGGYRLLSDFHSVRAYMLLIWAALLVPIIALNPNNLTVLLVPSMLVMAIGLNMVIRYWYKLFPKNPYARIFGLLPLGILMFSILQFNYQRYFYGMLYAPQIAQTFNSDVFLATQKIAKLPKNADVTMIVDAQNEPLYQIIAKYRPRTVVTSGALPIDRTGTWLIAEDKIGVAYPQLARPADQLITNERASAGLRFRVYQR